MLFLSCDPGQSMEIKNETKKDASVLIVFKKDVKRYYMFHYLAEKDSLLITLDTTLENSVQSFEFGLGTWEMDNRIDSLITMVESVEINTWKSKEIFLGEKQVEDFFKSRLKGKYKERLEILLE